MADQDGVSEQVLRQRFEMVMHQFHARLESLLGLEQREGFTAAFDGTQEDRAEGEEARDLARLERRMDDIGHQDGQEQERQHGMGW